MTYAEWQIRHPLAALELQTVFESPVPACQVVKSEAWAQQAVRFKIAHGGGAAWRNNVGATPAKCKHCGEPQQPIRFGLCNDSHKLNQRIKSSDVIGILPRHITEEDLGNVIGQFVAVEAKRPGWVFNENNEHERAQQAFLTLIAKHGGYAAFSTGELDL